MLSVAGARRWDSYERAADLFRKLGMPTTAAELGTWDASRSAPPPLGPFKTRGGGVSVDLFPDGRRALVAGGTGGLSIWDLATGRELKDFKQPGGVKDWYHVRLLPEGHEVLLASGHGEYLLFDVDAARTVVLFGTPSPKPGARGIDVSADGKLLVAARDRQVDVYELPTGRVLQTIPTGSAAFAVGRCKGDIHHFRAEVA